MCVSPKGVYSKDDCGKLKNKDSNHTRRSKQNTYHVVNKNIVPSKVTDGSRRKRGCLLGLPKLWLFDVLRLSWGAMGIPKLRPLPLLIPKSIKSSPKNLKTSQHKTQQKIS